MQSPIRIKIVGGLGNQIHALIAGYVLNSELNRDVVLDGRWLSWTGSNGHRKLNLQEIQVSERFTPKFLNSIQSIKKGPVRRKLSTLASKLDAHNFGCSISSSDFADARSLINYVRNNPDVKSLTGYFDTWDWARIAQGKSDFKWKFTHARDMDFNKTVKIAENYIGVHVRLGDYLNHPDIYPLPSEIYFQQAVQDLQQTGNKPYWIHTDDLRNLSRLYPNLLKDAERVLSPSDYDELHAFELLASHKYLVIANSTFSSWAAYVSSLKFDSKIICPKDYLMGEFRDTRPAEWIRK
jgi:hypothetical protein